MWTIQTSTHQCWELSSLSFSLSHSSCLQDRPSLMSSQLQPRMSTLPLPMALQSSNHPVPTHHLPASPWNQLWLSHPAAFAAIYSPMTPHRDWHGLPIPEEPTWSGMLASLCPCRTPHRWLNNAWAVFSFSQFTLFFPAGLIVRR